LSGFLVRCWAPFRGQNFTDLAALVYRLSAVSSQSFRPCRSARMKTKMAIFPALHEAIMNEDVLNVSPRNA
jgi:hypothetical protein